MHKSIRFLAILAVTGITFFFINATSKHQNTTSHTKAPLQDSIIKNVSNSYEIKALKLTSYMELAGEAVPLEKTDIRERMDRELLVNTYWQSNGLLLIKRANKFFPIIEPILAENGIPDDFKYLALAESGFLNVKSHAGAAGFWQFMRTTAKEYGLEVNKNVDERYNLELATKMATRYLKKAKEKFGSWTLAAAAYNAGSARINKRLTEQKVSNYYDLLLNIETSRYVFRILALKEVISNPKKYGFVYDTEDLYTLPKTYTIEVTTPIASIPDFAKEHNVTYKELKLANPWLRETKLVNVSGKKYYIKIPLE